MTNEQRFPLNWSAVKAWADRNHRTKPAPRRGGYYTACPVPKHRLKNQLISVWDAGDSHTYLHCWGGCTHQDIYEAIAEKISAPPVTEPRSDQATPPPQAETPPAAGPLTVAAIESHWPAVIQLLRRGQTVHERNVAALLRDARVTGLLAWTTPAVRALLRDARVTAVQADEVTLEFEFPSHAEQVEKPENRLVTEKALQQVLGRPLRVRAVVKDATERSTVAANPEKDIKPNAPSDTEDIEPPPVTKPRIEALEEEWYSPEAQLALDQLIDEQLANEQTAEYWENQATDAETKRKKEREKRVAAENTAENTAQKLQEYKGKVQDKLDKLRKDYKSANAKLLRRDNKIRKLDTRIRNIEEELPVSKSEVIEDAWSLLDQAPNAAIKEAWTRLETELYQALRHTLKVPGSRPTIQVLLNNAKNENYINSEQFLHLLVMYNQRNKTTHPDEITRTTLQLTKPEARAALAYLEPIIDQLCQRSPRTSS